MGHGRHVGLGGRGGNGKHLRRQVLAFRTHGTCNTEGTVERERRWLGGRNHIQYGRHHTEQRMQIMMTMMMITVHDYDDDNINSNHCRRHVQHNPVVVFIFSVLIYILVNITSGSTVRTATLLES